MVPTWGQLGLSWGQHGPYRGQFGVSLDHPEPDLDIQNLKNHSRIGDYFRVPFLSDVRHRSYQCVGDGLGMSSSTTHLAWTMDRPIGLRSDGFG